MSLVGDLPKDDADGRAAQRALAVKQAWLALGNERFEADGATFIRNRAFPRVQDANHVTRITASTPVEIDRLLARAEREFAGFPHRRFDVDSTTPPSFEARLALEGYRPSEALVMLLEGEPVGSARPHHIRLLADKADWAAYAALHAMDWREYHQRTGRPEDDAAGAAMLQSKRSKTPPMRYFLAFVDGEPRAYCSSWVGPEGFGQVEDVFTDPDFRHRGLATALIHQCVADCRARGAGPVVIVADPTDTPKQMYAAMGFRPVAVKREYGKSLPPAA